MIMYNFSRIYFWFLRLKSCVCMCSVFDMQDNLHIAFFSPYFRVSGGGGAGDDSDTLIIIVVMAVILILIRPY